MKKMLRILIGMIALWLFISFVDYRLVHGFEKPVFCLLTTSADDGGSGHYVGLGYSFDIKGIFMPEYEFPGVTQWTYYLFGIEMKTELRD